VTQVPPIQIRSDDIVILMLQLLHSPEFARDLDAAVQRMIQRGSVADALRVVASEYADLVRAGPGSRQMIELTMLLLLDVVAFAAINSACWKAVEQAEEESERN
jgi:hypothetical protein